MPLIYKHISWHTRSYKHGSVTERSRSIISHNHHRYYRRRSRRHEITFMPSLSCLPLLLPLPADNVVEPARLLRRTVQINPLLRRPALRFPPKRPASNVASEFRSEWRLDSQHRFNRRLLRRRRQRQIQFSDGFHHHNARLERNWIRRIHASDGGS